LNLSYLNPEGFLMDSLINIGIERDNDSTNVLRTIANWIGEARKNNKELLNIHETEIAKFLINGGYGNKTGQFKNKNKFFDRLKYSFDKWKTAGGKPDKPLNLANTLSKSIFEQEHDARLEKSKKEYDEAFKEHYDKHEDFLDKLIYGKISQERFDELMKPYTIRVTRTKQEYDRIRGQKDDVKKAATAQTALFGLKGDFGTIYTQFKGKPNEAIKHLLKVKNGECVAALYRSDIGDIDIVWGENDIKNKGFGLKHIYEKHNKEKKN